jgi:rhodanese-related sulfurtransferase
VRSILAADALTRMGYFKVSSMEGGIGAWKKAGLAVESGGHAKFNDRIYDLN